MLSAAEELSYASTWTVEPDFPASEMSFIGKMSKPYRRHPDPSEKPTRARIHTRTYSRSGERDLFQHSVVTPTGEHP